jgi:hypothetical protein
MIARLADVPSYGTMVRSLCLRCPGALLLAAATPFALFSRQS